MEGTELRFEAASFFYGEKESIPLVSRVYNFQTTLFSASEFLYHDPC